MIRAKEERLMGNPNEELDKACEHVKELVSKGNPYPKAIVIAGRTYGINHHLIASTLGARGGSKKSKRIRPHDTEGK